MKIKRAVLVAKKAKKKEMIDGETFAEELIKRFEYLGFNQTAEYESEPLLNQIIEMSLLRKAYRHYMEVIGVNLGLLSVTQLSADRQLYGYLLLNESVPIDQENNLIATFMSQRYSLPYLICLFYVYYIWW